jgi:hypothetical protein
VGNSKILSTATIAKGTQNVIDAIPGLKKYVDLTKLFKAAGEDLFRFLPKDKFLICFDDLERMSEKINPDDFMGLVNELVENKGYKVLIIAHEGEIKGGIKYKEKTIEKTIQFKNDLSVIFDSIVTNYENSAFAGYLAQHKPFFLHSLDPRHKTKEKQVKLSISFENIRSLKFAIEHFRPVFEIIRKAKDVSKKLAKQQLEESWLFTLATSIEFKEYNTLSFKTRKHLDEPAPSLSNLDLGMLIWGNDQPDQQPVAEDEWTFRNDFIKDYFERINAQYIYSTHIYGLITAGITIDGPAFLTELEHSYKVQNGVVKPAYEHLSKFLHSGYWNLTDEEFIPALTQLLDYARIGNYDDLLSYINAGVYLLPFNENLQLTKEQIIERLKAGVDIAIENITPSFLAVNQFDMASSDIQDDHLKQLRNHIKEQLKAKVEADLLVESLRLEGLFTNDLSALVKELLPENLHTRSPDSLLFNQFNTDSIALAVPNWTPASMMELSSLLEVRYLGFSYAERLTDEIQFLKNLKEYLEKQPDQNKVLSHNIITNYLIPKLDKSIKKLESYVLEQHANQHNAVSQEDE